MTYQAREIVIFRNEEFKSISLPLSSYLEKNQQESKFMFPNTALWRGYLGKWEIKNNKLFLIDLKGFVNIGSDDNTIIDQVGIRYLFKDQEEVFANWFSGEIILPFGEIIEHLNFDDIHEFEYSIQFKNGKIINIEIHDNIDRINIDDLYTKQPNSFIRMLKKHFRLFFNKIF